MLPILAITFQLTLPATMAGPGCSDSPFTERALNSLNLWATSPSAIYLLARDAVGGLEGQPYTLTHPGLGGMWGYYVTTTDSAGNESCPSDTLWRTQAATDVPPLPEPTTIEIFDIMGRRVKDMKRGQVYFIREGTRIRKHIGE